jgi:hypothetical protein
MLIIYNPGYMFICVCIIHIIYIYIHNIQIMANFGYCTHLCQNIGIYVYVNIYLYIIHAYIYM